MKSGLERQVLRTLKECPGLAVNEIATLLDQKQNTIAYHLKSLLRYGKITRDKRKGSCTFYYSAIDPKDCVRPEPKQPTDSGWHARYDALAARVKELEQWQASAIARHPDLKVSEDVLRARRIAAKANPDFATALLAGDKDGSPIMLAVLAAIEELAA